MPGMRGEKFIKEMTRVEDHDRIIDIEGVDQNGKKVKDRIEIRAGESAFGLMGRELGVAMDSQLLPAREGPDFDKEMQERKELFCRLYIGERTREQLASELYGIYLGLRAAHPGVTDESPQDPWGEDRALHLGDVLEKYVLRALLY